MDSNTIDVKTLHNQMAEIKTKIHREIRQNKCCFPQLNYPGQRIPPTLIDVTSLTRLPITELPQQFLSTYTRDLPRYWKPNAPLISPSKLILMCDSLWGWNSIFAIRSHQRNNLYPWLSHVRSNLSSLMEFGLVNVPVYIRSITYENNVGFKEEQHFCHVRAKMICLYTCK